MELETKLGFSAKKNGAKFQLGQAAKAFFGVKKWWFCS
jgi:hypothetical protein